MNIDRYDSRQDFYAESGAPDPFEVEAQLSPAARRGVRLARIAAYERCEALARYIPGERICLEFDA
jgi:hypothetical protein